MSDAVGKPANLESIVLFWVLVACSYVFVLPVSNNVVLFPVVASLGLVAAGAVIARGARIHMKLVLPAVLWLGFVVIGSVVAFIAGAESWPRVMAFMFVLPVFYFLIVVAFPQSLVRPLFWVGAITSIVISLIFITQALAAIGVAEFLRLPQPLWRLIDLKYVVDPNGPMRFTSTSLPPLLWWGAMWIASIAVDRRDRYLPPLTVRVIASIVCLSAAVLSLRRALLVALVLAPLIALLTAVALVWRNNADGRITFRGRTILTVAGVFAASMAIVFIVQPKSFEAVGASVNAIVGVAEKSQVTVEQPPAQETTPSPIVPPKAADGSNLAIKASYDEIRQLEAEFLLTPDSYIAAIFGNGIGAAVDRGDYARAGLEERPWQSDLPYHLVFFWSGFVGVLLVLATAVAGMSGLRFAMRKAGDLRGVLFVAAVGAIALLIANASNPYMQAVGHLWPLFFPFMIANVATRDAVTRKDGLVVPALAPLLRARVSRSGVRVARDTSV